MKVLGIQIDSSEKEAPKARLQRILDVLNDSTLKTELIVLPEHWISGAFNLLHDPNDMANLYKIFLKEAQNLANKKNLYIHTGSGLYLDQHKKLRNTSFILSPGDLKSISYNKMYAFRQEFGEIIAGENLVSLNLLGTSISPLICYDLRFPESFRSEQNFGSEIYIVSAAWPQIRIETWSHLLKTRAIENQAYVLGINGVGKQQEEELGGNSAVFDPSGNLVASAGIIEESLLFEVNLTLLRQHRASLPFLTDAKISKETN